MRTKLILLNIAIPFILSSQTKTGYYINWNVDHTERSVKPSVNISQKDSKIINSYFVEFDEKDRFTEVKYYYSGSPSIHSSYGAFHMKRVYTENHFDDTFYNENNERVANNEGAFTIRYHLNEDGFWYKKEVLDSNSDLVDIKGVHSLPACISLISRDSLNRIHTEVRINTQNDTVPDINGFKMVHFGFNKDGYIKYRKQLDEQGRLINGSLGYAQVNFQCNENGVFYDEEFLDVDGRLTIHPRILAAKLNFRNFDKYGKYRYIHYIDENGYPHEDRSYVEIEYHENTSIRRGVFYDRKGLKTEDPRGIAEFIFRYSEDGKLLERVNFNLSGAAIK